MAAKPTGKSIKQPLEAYLNSGRFYKERRQFQLAIKNFQQALTLAVEMKYEKQVTRANIDLGHAYKLNNQIQTAIQHYEKALEIAKERGYKQEETNANLGLGRANRLSNQIQTAILHSEKALKIAIERGYKQEETRAHLDLGRAYRLSNQIQTAMEHYEKVLKIAKERGHKLEETLAYLGLGDVYIWNNQIQTAMKHYKQALEIAKERGYKLEETRAYLGLGYVYRLNNQVQTAMEHYEKALKITKGQGYKKEETLAYLGLGDAYILNNQIQTAMGHYEKALEIAKKRKDKFGKTCAYLGLGKTYRLNNQIQTAIEHYEKALEIAKERGYKQKETLAYLGLGKAYRLNNQIQTAMENFKKALAIAKEQGSKHEETRVYRGLGKAYRLNNQIQTAMEHYEKAWEIAKERGYKRLEYLTRNTIEELSKITDLDTVDKNYNTNSIKISDTSNDAQLQDEIADNVKQINSEYESISDDRIVSAKKVLLLEHSYQTEGRNEEAIKSYEQAVPIANETGRNDIKAKAYQHLGNVFTRTSEYKKAIEHYKKAREIFPSLQADEMEVIAYQWLGYNHLQAGLYQESIWYYNEVVKLASQLGCKTREVNASIGLGSAFSYIGDLFNLGDTKKAIRSIQEAQTFAKKEVDTDSNEIHSTHAQEKSPRQKAPSLQVEARVESIHKAQTFAKDIDTDSPNVETMHKHINSTEQKASYSPVPDSKEGHSTHAEERSPELKALSSQVIETDPKREEIYRDEKEIWFKDTFLDSKRKLKEEIHEELRSFPWLCGAYGLTAPTKKIARPHIYLTVKRGMKKSDVRHDLEDKFKCDAKEYFELLQEPKRKPKIKYLGRDRKRSKATSSAPSVKAVAGGGVLACIKNSSNNSNPLRVPEENERDDFPVAQGTGTLTMFCAHDKKHYALTCFHVCCATDESRLNATLNKKENIQEIRSSLSIYVKHAKEQQYYFAERVAVENNNEPISYGDDGSNYTPLGDFHNYHFDNKCDILSLKVSKGTEIDCKILDITSPNWNDIWDEFYERILRTGHNPVEVEKIGFSSALTYGHIVPCDFSNIQEKESLFQDAIVVKGCGGPFLEGGDSGSLVFFHDKNNQKQVFAYGVCELDELPALIKQHKSTSLTSHGNAQPAQPTTSVDDDDSDGSSIWSGEDYSCSPNEDEAVHEGEEETEHKDEQGAEIEDKIKCQKDNECENEFENINKRECGQDDECKVKCEEKNKYECEDENEYEDQNKSEDESGDNRYDDDADDQSDFEVVFQAESESNVSNVTGPYFICLRLDTALENLGLDKAACFSDCGSN